MKFTTTALVVLANAGTLGAQATSVRDSIPLTRAAAIAAALAGNPQLEVAREQTAQAKARRTEAVAIPDPTATASLDDQPGFLQLGQAQSRNVDVGIAVPFPDKFRLRNRIASADVRSAELSYVSVRQ
jgi:outer membrane protein TolC